MANAFLLLSGARPAGLDLLGSTRVGFDDCTGGFGVTLVWIRAVAGVGMVCVGVGLGACARNCCGAVISGLFPLNSNPFLIFLVMTTSGHVARIFAFIFSSAKGCRENKVARE